MKKKKFDDVLYVKLPTNLKTKLKEKADNKVKNVSEYIRDLIIKDLSEE